MATSTAVVTSNIDSVPEVAGDAGVLHDPHDVDAHVKSIERLLEDAEKRRTLTERASDRAAQFTWARSAAETVAVY